MTRRWQSKKYFTSAYYVSERVGVYIIGHQEEVEGLPILSNFAYVGQTKNMRRRLTEHDKLSECNPYLRDYLDKHGAKVRVWYTTDLQQSDLDAIERRLIRELNPTCNQLRYKKRGKNE